MHFKVLHDHVMSHSATLVVVLITIHEAGGSHLHRAVHVDSVPASERKDESWNKIILVREEVVKELEKLRVTGAIGSSLDAEVEIYANSELKKVLATVGDELRFVFITSYASVYDENERPDDVVTGELEGLFIKVVASPHKKCIRCWHHREDVSSHAEHPEICGRCIDNVEGKGESRNYC